MKRVFSITVLLVISVIMLTSLSGCGKTDIVGEWKTVVSEEDGVFSGVVFSKDGKYQQYVNTDHGKHVLNEGEYYHEEDQNNNSAGYVKIYDNSLNVNLNRAFDFRIKGEKYGAAEADSDLMYPLIPAGSIVFYKILEYEDIKNFQPGDRIVYMSMSSDSFGETITREIRRITETSDGEIGYVTYALSNNIDEETIVSPDFILGEYVGNIPFCCVNEKKLEYEIENGNLTLKDDDVMMGYGR